MEPVPTIATPNTGRMNEYPGTGQAFAFLNRAINSVSHTHIHLPEAFAATANRISLAFYRISDLLRPAEPDPYDGALCSICLDDFQNFVGAAFLPGCKKPTWLHPDCLSQHIQSRIADPITEAEINGVGIACPKCYGYESHDMPVKKLGHLITSPESQQRLQDFHLQSQFRIFGRDPLSPLLDPILFKNATCPDCQHSYFVNLREPDQIIIQCTGLQVAPIDPLDNRSVEAVPCTRMFCANCEALPHNGMSCFEAANRSPGQRLADLNATLDAYQQARIDDNCFRPCPKCDNLIQKSTGCLHIQRTGLHEDENVPEDPGWCDHNICFACLKDWGTVMRSGSSNITDPLMHDFFTCNDPDNRQRVYAEKIAKIKNKIRALDGSHPEPVPEASPHNLPGRSRLQRLPKWLRPSCIRSSASAD